MKFEFNVSLVIVIITVLTSIMAWRNDTIMRKWIFNPYMIHKRKQYWRFLSAAFLHADWMHLAFNMFVLYEFGKHVEAQFDVVWIGEDIKHVLLFIGLYIPAAILSCFYTFEKQKNNIHYNALGASGAVSAVVFGFIAINPTAMLAIFGIIPIPAFLYGGLYLLISWILARRAKDNIGHDAHFFGALYGLMYIFIIQPDKLRNFFESISYFVTNIF
jgi:membrane associated rhomboid family serine protease